MQHFLRKQAIRCGQHSRSASNVEFITPNSKNTNSKTSNKSLAFHRALLRNPSCRNKCFVQFAVGFENASGYKEFFAPGGPIGGAQQQYQMMGENNENQLDKSWPVNQDNLLSKVAAWWIRHSVPMYPVTHANGGAS